MTALQTSNLKRSIPNALTIARLALAIIFFAILSTVNLSQPGDPASKLIFALSIFVLAAVTDALDGMLARRWNAISQFGRVMDPFADKVLVLGAFVLLAGPGWSISTDQTTIQATGVMPWMTIVILARELLITSLRGVLEAQGVDFSATWSGKIKMILQSAIIPIILLLIALTDVNKGTTSRSIILSLVWLCVLFTLWSAVPYLIRAKRALASTNTDTSS